MGMENNAYTVPICIHKLMKHRDIENDNHSGYMYILQRTVYNNMTVESEWKKIMELRGYEDGLVIDDSGVAENFMDTIPAYCYELLRIN